MQTVENDAGVWVKVSERGQMCLPAEIRRRWGIEDGGRLRLVDMGGHVALLPNETIESVWTALREAVESGEYARWVAEIDDPDLRTE